MDKTSRKMIIAGNWKMNKLASQVPAFSAELLGALPASPEGEAVLCVPFPLIYAMRETLKGTFVKVGAQDVSVHESGAYTGEVSAAMLKDLGVSYCIIGHSERRNYHHETDEEINDKMSSLLKTGITPIVCVGESLSQRDGGKTLAFVEKQIRAAFFGVTAEKAKGIVVAYEPIWAIGTGRTATAEQAQEVCGHIRGVLADIFGADTARKISIIYGGSMNGTNAEDLLAQPDIDGGLIGGASLKPMEFSSILKLAEKI